MVSVVDVAVRPSGPGGALSTKEGDSMQKHTIEYENGQVTVSATTWPIGPGSHVWTGEVGIWTEAGLDGPYDLGQGTEDEIRDRVRAYAADAGAGEAPRTPHR